MSVKPVSGTGRLLFTVFTVLFFTWGQAQLGLSQIPEVNVKDLSGKTVSTAGLANNGKPMVVSFWATWCKPCIQELSAIHENYTDWQKESGVKVVAVSIDDSRQSAKVQPFVQGRGWQFDMLLDENSDLKRAMGVVNVPHTFVIDGTGKIIAQHTAYVPGDEDKLWEEIQQAAKQ